eukprot:CAMPEP_0201169612 /NCGR_PEP_ID=MMETSP0851-20130426/80831_1 /ASSEMBLY_ACC=CAM_ASM_000631 /TAXON_ID=183588 /ORGANISM="Pseudo-nitzschia fraudulenta, Strain WWA7" /LENGTH=515 /DNA_ID=CAMNT_0047451421 /DNA_START=32 /DNA_END=1579 /DNA_ORIENTATION=-
MENNNFIGDYDDGPDEHEAILPPMFRMKSINDVDSLLSREMMALTVDDRNAINEEIHGVGTMAPDETSGLIESSLREFQKEVDAIRRVKNNKVVDDFESIDGNNKYVETDSFKLVFLRCELFDAKKAALRYLRYLDLLCDVFGTVALERPLNIANDFTKDDIKWFRMGHYQLLPFRDRAGRRVFASVADMGFALEDRMRLKIALYLLTKAVEDVDTQKNGMVLVFWPALSFSGNATCGYDGKVNDEGKIILQKDMTSCTRLMMAMPVRPAAVHFCFPDTKFYRLFFSITTLAIGSAANRSRVRFHIGELMELQYCIKSFGIPVDLIPITDTGSIKTNHLKVWIKLRTRMDQAQSDGVSSDDSNGSSSYSGGSNSTIKSPLLSIVDCPSCKDVLFRSGKSTIVHPGNVMFRSMVESRIDEHNNCSRLGKKSIVMDLIDSVESVDGRFLTWDKSGYWKVLYDQADIRTRVGVSIRNFKQVQKARTNVQSNESSTYAFTNQGFPKRQKKSNGDTKNKA